MRERKIEREGGINEWQMGKKREKEEARNSEC